MHVSVCICTRNRPEALVRALDSIQSSGRRVSQIVVSDDSDDGRTRTVVERHGSDITYVEGPRGGLGANRNRAVRAATGTHVLFLDDDAELGRDFVRLMEREWVKLTPERQQKAILAGVEMQGGRAIRANEQDLLGFQSRPYRTGELLRTVVINASLFPRALFDSILFDPRLQYGYDEVDVSTQAVALGFEIVPCFEAANDHHPSSINRDEYRPFVAASRLYVTLKRRRVTEGRPIFAWSSFLVAVGHTYLTAVRRDSVAGLRDAHRTIRQAWAYYANLKESAR